MVWSPRVSPVSGNHSTQDVLAHCNNRKLDLDDSANTIVGRNVYGTRKNRSGNHLGGWESAKSLFYCGSLGRHRKENCSLFSVDIRHRQPCYYAARVLLLNKNQTNHKNKSRRRYNIRVFRSQTQRDSSVETINIWFLTLPPCRVRTTV